MIGVTKQPNGLVVGKTVHLDPHALPEIRIISEAEAREIAALEPERHFVITHIGPVNNPKK
jgi:hypothetical protein